MTANPEADSRALLSSLAHLVRGLSALFWGLPIALVVGYQTAKTDWLQPLRMIPPIVAFALLCYALIQLSYFQKQERVWRVALDRAKIFALINLGLSPFLYWWNRMPGNPFFTAIVELLAITGVVFLFCLNLLLCRLAAMLPDETVRLETRLFTRMNNYLLLAAALIFLAYFFFSRIERSARFFAYLFSLVDRGGIWQVFLFREFVILLFMILLPVATTMTLIWKIKELILASVFSANPPNQTQ